MAMVIGGSGYAWLRGKSANWGWLLSKKLSLCITALRLNNLRLVPVQECHSSVSLRGAVELVEDAVSNPLDRLSKG